MFKAFNLVFGVLFLICAVLQWNDPDPFLWIPLYLLAALSCAYAFKRVSAVRLNIFNIVLYAAYAVFLFVTKDGVISWATEHHFDSLTHSMMASSPWIENTREFGGLFIMLLVCAVNLYVGRQQAPVENSPEADETRVSL
jgi:glucan phosphoethanolaminetransferase (alkaline phosphatase superfamily)